MSSEKENIGGLHNEKISMILSEPFMADLSSASMESNKRKDLILYLMPTKIYGVVGTSEDIKLNLILSFNLINKKGHCTSLLIYENIVSTKLSFICSW